MFFFDRKSFSSQLRTHTKREEEKNFFSSLFFGIFSSLFFGIWSGDLDVNVETYTGSYPSLYLRSRYFLQQSREAFSECFLWVIIRHSLCSFPPRSFLAGEYLGAYWLPISPGHWQLCVSGVPRFSTRSISWFNDNILDFHRMDSLLDVDPVATIRTGKYRRTPSWSVPSTEMVHRCHWICATRLLYGPWRTHVLLPLYA